MPFTSPFLTTPRYVNATAGNQSPLPTPDGYKTAVNFGKVCILEFARYQRHRGLVAAFAEANSTSAQRKFWNAPPNSVALRRDDTSIDKGKGYSCMEKLSEYLTIAESAKMIGVAPNTLRNWGRDGRIPMHRNPANGYRLFLKRDLESFLKRTAQTRHARKKPR